MRTLIQHGYVLDPSDGTQGIRDILIEDACISAVKPKINQEADTLIDASGCTVMPGFIDLHVHLREPGYEYKETVASGTAAAAAGGFTTVCAMPNTKPVIDSPEGVRAFYDIVKRDAAVHVLTYGAVTKQQEGLELTDIRGMATEGICGISEDGRSVMNILLYREAMKQAAVLGIPVMAHCEDRELLQGGVLNTKAAEKFGLPGISDTVEDYITIRDILLANELGTRLHLCHCSTKLSMEFLRLAKKIGAPVTAEVCPHHFSMSEEEILTEDTNFKMNPPLRSREDVAAVLEGIRDGSVDAIATDHAPHSIEDKKKSMKEAPFGIVGLETAYALSVTKLVRTEILTPLQLADKLSLKPARILGLDEKDGRGTLQPRAIADLVITDPTEKWIIDPNRFRSKGRNTPFGGEFVYGRVKMTICEGKTVYHDI